jgi:hypothetical protein
MVVEKRIRRVRLDVEQLSGALLNPSLLFNPLLSHIHCVVVLLAVSTLSMV